MSTTPIWKLINVNNPEHPQSMVTIEPVLEMQLFLNRNLSSEMMDGKFSIHVKHTKDYHLYR
jgi:hypothetical protein